MTTAAKSSGSILDWASKDGEFRRKPSSFRSTISKDDANFKSEKFVNCI
ncbi:6486_t:CDS:2, partial [Cetraspora pellucida]